MEKIIDFMTVHQNLVIISAMVVVFLFLWFLFRTDRQEVPIVEKNNDPNYKHEIYSFEERSFDPEDHSDYNEPRCMRDK